MLLLVLVLAGAGSGGCATIRVTDPARTATEQFLLSGAVQSAISRLTVDGLRDQVVYVETNFFSPTMEPLKQDGLQAGGQPTPQERFLIGELRAKLLREGIRLTPKREQATVVVEVRSGGLGVDRYEYLLGIPAIAMGGGAPGAALGSFTTPELAVLKNTKQRGFASVAIVAYRATSGEMMTQSGPYTGETIRDDYWVLGTGPRTIGDIPPAQKRQE